MRVHELAAMLEMPAGEILALLRARGEFVRSAASNIANPVARRILADLGRSDLLLRAGSTIPEAPSGDKPFTPSSMDVGWRAGAVPRPTHPDVVSNIDSFARTFPIFRSHQRALGGLGSQIVFARITRDSNGNPFGSALVRFSGAIESAFGLTREVMIYYTQFRDVQVRTFKTAIDTLRSMPREVTPDLFFFSSPDSRLRVKLDDWSTFAHLAIPLEDDLGDAPMAFVSLIRDYVYKRDLFFETSPVRAGRFFGRRTLLQSLRDDVRQQRVSGVFGLRKAGKTSVLFELSDILSDEGMTPVLMDLEAYPSPPEDPIPDILSGLRARLLEELRRRNLRTKELADAPSELSIVDFKNRFQQLLRAPQMQETKVVLMLDEIEYLTPADQIDIAEGPMPQIAQLLAALRSLVQETSNFAFVLSGLTSAIVEGGRLYGRPNPLFSWAKSYYVSPLSREEADEMALAIGAKMGIEISEGSLEALYDASSGHAFLYRSLASSVVSGLPTDTFRRQVSRSQVLGSLADWKSRVAGNITEMLQHVARYYSTEAILLDILRTDPNDFFVLAVDEPQALRHLVDLGLIRQDGGTYELTTVLEL